MISYNIIYSILVILLTSAVCNADEHCTEEARDVTFIKQFGVEVQVTSPQYPNNYTTDAECYFAQFGGVFDEPFVFSVVQEVNECSIPYTVVGSNNSQFPNQYERCSKEGNILINKKFVLKRQPSTLENFRFSLPSGSISSFTFKIAVYPLLSMEPANSTVNLTTAPTAYITSHQGFPGSAYSTNLDNKLTLTDIPSDYDMFFEFIYMNLGTWDRCRTGSGVKDVFRVYRDEEIDPVYECADYIGTYTPDSQQISSANSIRLGFMTNSEYAYNGFLLQVHRLPSNSSTTTVTSLYGTSIDGTEGAGVSISTPSTNSTTSIISSTITPSTPSTPSTISTTSTASNTKSSGLAVNSSATDSTSKSSDTSSSLSGSASATSYYSTHTRTNATTDSLATTDDTIIRIEVMISAIVAGSGGSLLLVIIVVLALKLARHQSNRKHPDETVEGDQEVGDIPMTSMGATTSTAADTNMMDSRPDVAMMSGYSDVELCYTTADNTHSAAVKLAKGVESKTAAVEGEVTYAAIQRSKEKTSTEEETAVDEGSVYAAINKGQAIKKEVVSNDAVYAAIGEANKKRDNDEEKEGAVTADEVEMIANDLYGTY